VCGRLDIDFHRIQETAYSQNPPWMMRRIICDRSLLGLPKGIHQEVIRSNFAELESNKYYSIYYTGIDPYMDLYLCTGPA
jgi:hypothetical protein